MYRNLIGSDHNLLLSSLLLLIYADYYFYYYYLNFLLNEQNSELISNNKLAEFFFLTISLDNKSNEIFLFKIFLICAFLNHINIQIFHHGPIINQNK